MAKNTPGCQAACLPACLRQRHPANQLDREGRTGALSLGPAPARMAWGAHPGEQGRRGGFGL